MDSVFGGNITVWEYTRGFLWYGCLEIRSRVYFLRIYAGQVLADGNRERQLLLSLMYLDYENDAFCIFE